MCQCVGGCSCTSNSSLLPIGPTGATGATGATGTAGTNGTTILNSYNSSTGVSSPSSAVETSLYSYTTAANTLSTVGDEIEVYTRINVAAGIAATTVGIRFKLGGLSIYTDTIVTALIDTTLIYKIKISKISNTEQLWTIEKIGVDTTPATDIDIVTLTSNANTTTTNVFQITAQGSGAGAGVATLYKNTLYKYSV